MPGAGLLDADLTESADDGEICDDAPKTEGRFGGFLTLVLTVPAETLDSIEEGAPKLDVLVPVGVICVRLWGVEMSEKNVLGSFWVRGV